MSSQVGTVRHGISEWLSFWARYAPGRPALLFRDHPSATAAVLRDGWLHTGDLAVCSERGYVKIVDRKKDMIISGGLNVYPAEVERVLSAHPAVVEVAVVGVPDERWGETPLACVVSKDPGLTLAALAEFAAGELAGYKRPRRLRLLASLPRNSNGKVIKQQLRSLGSEP